MAKKLNIPSVLGIDTEDLPPSLVIYLQAIREGMEVLDNNVVYKDNVNVVVPPSRIRQASAQGQSFSVSGVSLASGDDYAVLLNDFKTLVEEHNRLRTFVETLADQVRGTNG